MYNVQHIAKKYRKYYNIMNFMRPKHYLRNATKKNIYSFGTLYATVSFKGINMEF